MGGSEKTVVQTIIKRKIRNPEEPQENGGWKVAYPDFVTISKLASLQTIEEISQPADDILVTLGNGQTLPWKNLTGLR